MGLDVAFVRRTRLSHGCFIAASRGGTHDRLVVSENDSMIDVLYILVTVAFFALMLAYVRGCERLGQDASGEEERP